jgi:LytS/YehU family sensor histidine kinase
MDTWETFLLMWRTQFASSFLWYWMIVAIHYALRFHTESQQRMRDAAQLQARLIEARLQALRSQLNPHFMYNVLNSIAVLARKKESDAVTEIIDRLGVLLRTALDESRPDCLPLRQEMELVESYLAIEHVRFADRLAVATDISGEAAAALVPAMILQPIVENAVKHAVAVSEQPTTITIVGGRRGDTLRLRVSDTGPGFGADYCRRPGHVGLSTTAERLDELYGADHVFTTTDTPGGGATVIIEIPYTASIAADIQRSVALAAQV